MSRRLRFQIKPNINVSNVNAEEGKPINITSPAPAAPPISNEQPKITSVVIGDNIPVNNAGVNESINRRSPSPLIVESTAASITEDINRAPEISLPISTPTSSNLIDEEIETGRNSTAINDQTINSIPLTNEGPPMDAIINTNENQTAAAAQIPQTSGYNNKKYDWRTMRKEFKGRKLDRSTFLMRDLIFWTPEEEKKPGEDDDTSSVKSGASQKKRIFKKKFLRFETQQSIDSEKRDESKSSAPQVKVDAAGNLMIDETSLVVDRRDQGTEMAKDFETVDETFGYGVGPPRRGPRINSMSFRRNKKPSRGRLWGKFETDKFYRILAFAGLDFALVHELFPSRSRTEIKRKYNKECNENPLRIDQALMSKCDRHGPWTDLKKMIIERGHCSSDERSRALLDSARELIEAEDERIEIETGIRKPSVDEATRIAGKLSKNGFGDQDEDDVSEEQLQVMASKIIATITKEDKLAASQAKKKKRALEKSQAPPMQIRKNPKRMKRDIYEDAPSSPESLVL